MGLIFKISIRNLLRQKRRNILLGIAIGIGIMILVITNSYTRGITDIILNKLLVVDYGHVGVTAYENGRQPSLIRDSERFLNIIKGIEGVKDVRQSVASFNRVIGNGKVEMMNLIGMPPTQDNLDWFSSETKYGNAADFTNSAIENPVVISENKAHDLNVKVGDYLSMQLRTLTDQVQSARLTVVCIIKSANVMRSTSFYIPLDNLKDLLGYKPYESGPFQIVLDKIDNPKAALKVADDLYAALKPGFAAYYGSVISSQNKADATVLSFFTNTNDMELLSANLKIIAGKWTVSTNPDTILIDSKLARKMNVRPGDKITTLYRNKFEGKSTTNSYKIGLIFDSEQVFGNNNGILLLSENNFYPSYFKNIPPSITNYANAYQPETNNILYPALATEWRLLDRTYNSDDYQYKIKEVTRDRWEGLYIDVSTMYEFASFILSIESLLNAISLLLALVLFFIIMIGVTNTLRMTIRERTREIGTVRAVGMRRSDVRNNFIMETLLLTVLASLAGIIIGFIIMGILSIIPIHTDSLFGTFLYRNRMNFAPSIGKPLAVLALIGLFSLELLLIRFDNKVNRFLWTINIFGWLYRLAKRLFTGKKIEYKGRTGYINVVNIVLIILAITVSLSGGGIFCDFMMILMLLTSIAYTPATQAAYMSAASALRHYE